MQIYLKFVVALLVAILALTIYFAAVNKNTLSVDTTYASRLSACGAFQNNSVQKITDTSRVFINLPKDIYPGKGRNLQFKTISGSTTAGWISNAGPYAEAMPAREHTGCWSYYYEFDGEGEINLFVKSAMPQMPDYSVKFIVSKNPAQ